MRHAPPTHGADQCRRCHRITLSATMIHAGDVWRDRTKRGWYCPPCAADVVRLYHLKPLAEEAS